VVARFTASADDLAFNLGVLCESLASLEAVPLISQPVSAPMSRRLVPLGDSAPMPIAVVPAGTLVERADAIDCPRLTRPAGALVASPEGDFTVRFVATWWPPEVSAASVRAACEGAGGQGGPGRRATHLGVPYVLDSQVVESGRGGAVRLELWAPERKTAFAAGAFAAWVGAVSGAGPQSR
jgi:hypothetical protein